LLPESDRNIYYCDAEARQLTAIIDEHGSQPLYTNYFGGVVALKKDTFYNLNGFPNRYAGWGGEDDDMSARALGLGLLYLCLIYCSRLSMLASISQFFIKGKLTHRILLYCCVSLTA
jgi:predicted glycosyltransferase involved in capsule biosynthesis